jgi:hypothetical protein
MSLKSIAASTPSFSTGMVLTRAISSGEVAISMNECLFRTFLYSGM